MEAQLERRHIRANYTLAIATALAAALIIGSGVGFAIGNIFQAKPVEIAPVSGDGLAALTSTTRVRDDWPYVQDSTVSQSATRARDDWPFVLDQTSMSPRVERGVQTSHMEQADGTSTTGDDSLVTDLPDLFGRGPR